MTTHARATKTGLGLTMAALLAGLVQGCDRHPALRTEGASPVSADPVAQPDASAPRAPDAGPDASGPQPEPPTSPAADASGPQPEPPTSPAADASGPQPEPPTFPATDAAPTPLPSDALLEWYTDGGMLAWDTRPLDTETVPGNWGPPYCHDLAPAAGTLQLHGFAGTCPVDAEPRGGDLIDGVYREIHGEICRSQPGSIASVPVRLRISGAGTRLDWSAETPVFSARLERLGSSTLQVIETCRTVGNDQPQPPWAQPFTIVDDQLTFYNGLYVTVFLRES
jgi:hypothetical protein